MQHVFRWQVLIGQGIMRLWARKNISKTTFLFFIVSSSNLSLAMEIEGVLRLNGTDAKSANIEDAIVYFLPDDLSAVKNEVGEYQITMARKQFVPRTMAVPVGSTVKVPNDDTISHNAFSPSRPNNFDLDLYGRGQEKTFTVNGPGVIKIYCNVHYHMVAYVLGLDTPYFTQPFDDGRFSLKVPDVPGKVVVWHERTSDYVQTVNPEHSNIVDIDLRITKRRLPDHTNKLGSSYRRVRR